MGNIAIPQIGGVEKYQVLARVDDGAYVTATNGIITRKYREKNCVALITGLPDGNWTIEASIGDYHKKETVEIAGDNQRHIIWLHLNMVPDFISTGLKYRIVNDSDTELNEFAGTTGDWKIRFEENFHGSYGTIKFSDLHGQKVDIFLVGGGGNATRSFAGWGGCGGGGGRTATFKGVILKENVEYRITIGGPGGNSRIYAVDGSLDYYGYAGGHAGKSEGGTIVIYGGNGGCGGGGGHGRDNPGGNAGHSGNGGSNGENGTAGANGGWYDKNIGVWYSITSRGGTGQGSNTYEFGDPTTGRLYSSGGAGGSYFQGYEGSPGSGMRGANTGAGGNSNTPYSARQNGHSGIIIIRNAR